MYCPSCGTLNGAGNLFCQQCGNPTSPNIPIVEKPSYSQPQQAQPNVAQLKAVVRKERLKALVGAAVVVGLIAGGVVYGSRKSDNSAGAEVTAGSAASPDTSVSQVLGGASVVDSLSLTLAAEFTRDIMKQIKADGEIIFDEANDSISNSIESYWGTQLDCSDTEPLMTVGFSGASSTIFATMYSNYWEGKAEPLDSIQLHLKVRFFSDFNTNSYTFQERADNVSSFYNGCNDEDFYPHSESATINSCATKMFADSNFAFLHLNEICAKEALRSVSYVTDSRGGKKRSYFDEKQPEGGSRYSMYADPSSANITYTSWLFASVTVHEQFDIGYIILCSASPLKTKILRKTIEDKSISCLMSGERVAEKLISAALSK